MSKIYQHLFGIMVVVLLNSNTSLTAQSITIRVDRILAERSENPIGYCGNFLGDSDRFGNRKRSMADVLKATGSGTYRWPAGTIAENYLFHPYGQWENATQGLRPRCISRQKFPRKQKLTDDGFFRDSMDFDEFVATCKTASAEPIVMVSSYGWKLPGASVSRKQLIASAREWVRYANVTCKYGVKYWEIGNEVDLKKCPIALDEYFEYYAEVAAAMKKVDPTIKTGMGLIRGSAEPYFKEGFARIPEHIDFVVAHQYHSHHKNFEHYSPSTSRYINSIEAALRNIDRFAPADQARHVEVLVTEFSAFSPQRRWDDTRPTITKALLTFETMANALGYDSRVRSLNFWITHNPWNEKVTDANALHPDNTPTALGKVVEIMGSHFKPMMVEATRLAGSIRSFATYDPKTKALTVFLVNKSSETQTADVSLPGYDGEVLAMTVFRGKNGPSSTEFQVEESAPLVTKPESVRVELEPASITVVDFQRKK